ncbi:MAG: DNA polymerase III subunit delta' [Tuberibacillus sp.]
MNWSDISEKQPTAARILLNGIKNDRLAHAYLFSGQRGTGKRETAIQLARTFFCRMREDINPCGDCPDCRRIESGNHPDLTIIEPDGRSIKKQQITELIKAFSYKGVESGGKFFIIEQADLMTTQAANSLLKFIEEPEGTTVSVLMTENIQSILNTIISRCQVLTFKPLSQNSLSLVLTEDGISDVMAKTVTALTADIEKAKELSRDEWFASARSIVIHFMEELFTQPNHAIITMYEKCALHFDDSDKMKVLIELMLIWLRDCISLQSGRKDDVVFYDHTSRLERIAESMTLERSSNGLSILMEANRRLNSNGNYLSVLEYLSLRLQEGASIYV